MKTLRKALLSSAALLAAVHSAAGGSFSADFNDGLLPAGSQLFGNGSTAGVIEATGGAGDTGCVKLTKNVNSITGTYIVNDLDAGAPVNGFTATFKMLVGGGSAVPADGCSFCVANDLPNAAFGEAGAGTKLKVAFDIYDNVDGNPNNEAGEAPAFNVYWNNALISRTRVPLASMVTNSFVEVLVRINPDGRLDLTWNDTAIYTGLYVGFQPIAGARFGWGGRTGGLNANQFVDDINITTTTGALLTTPYIVRHPISIRVANGYPALFNIVDNNAAGVGYRWQKKAPADPDFGDIPLATAIALQTAPLTLADSGTLFRVVVENAEATLLSDPAGVEVVDFPVATPNATYNFDDGLVPAGSNAYGTATALPSGGVGDSGHMRLTEAVNAQAGTWTVDDLNGGLPVESIDIFWKLKMSNGTAIPADGFGFHWAPNLPNAGFPSAEEPVGTGLSVCFDVYDNTDGNPFNGGEGPAIDVFWLNARVGGTTVPLEFLNTLGTFQDVRIRLSSSGMIDVMFNGIVLVYQLQVPNWTAFSSARYGFAARTGGLNQIHAIDEVTIQSTTYAGPIAFLTHPQDATVVPGATATFTVSTNDPNRATYQWQAKAPADPDFTNIDGASADTYTTPPLSFADNGTQYRCHVERPSLPSSADSNPATLTVVDLTRPLSPQILDTFDDAVSVANIGSAPDTVQTLSGDYAIVEDLGSDGSPALRLTDLTNTQFGTLVIDDFNAGVAVGGFTAALKVQITGPNPADGWSFSWSDAIAQTQVYGTWERGLGDDLRIGFITYTPNVVSVEVYSGASLLAKVPVPIALLQTDGDPALEEVLIRLTLDPSGTGGRLFVAQDGVLIVNNLSIPGFRGLTNARFAVAARTGGLNELHVFDDIAIQTELTPYGQWQVDKFGPTPNLIDSAPGANPDTDEYENIDEYALAQDPNSPGSIDFSPLLDGGELSLTLPKNRQATDVTMVFEWSDDLVTWSTAGVTQTVVDDTNPGYQLVKGSVLASGSRRQLRARFTLP